MSSAERGSFIHDKTDLVLGQKSPSERNRMLPPIGKA